MRNLIELLNGFYDLNIPNQINPSSSFLFITLLRKFNGTKNKANGEYFPEVLPIYNSELSHLTGIEDRSLRRARRELTTFRLIESDDTTWILKYESRGTKNSGIYTINYELLSLFDYGQFGNGYFPNKDDYGQIGNGKCTNTSKSEKITDKLVTENADFDPKSAIITDKNVPLSRTKLNETKLNKALSIPVPVQSTISKIVFEKNTESESEENTENEKSLEELDREYFDIGKKLIEEFYPLYFINQQGGLLNSEKTKLIINIGLVSDGRQELVRRCMANVASKLKNPANLLSWTWESIEKTLDWGDAEHGNNGKNGKR